MWHTEPAPAGIAVVGFPSVADRETYFEVKIPYVLGLISTRSLTGEVSGIFELVARAQDRIENGSNTYVIGFGTPPAAATDLDTNNDGVIQVGEIKPMADLNNNGIIDPNEITGSRSSVLENMRFSITARSFS